MLRRGCCNQSPSFEASGSVHKANHDRIYNYTKYVRISKKLIIILYLNSIAKTVLTCVFLYQQTPMHVAAREGHEYTVKALLKKTPNVDIQDKDGVSVYVRQSAEDCWFEFIVSSC